jgi:O-methyltransferase
MGYEIRRKTNEYPDFDADLLALCDRVRPYTLTSNERIAALVCATEYVVRKGLRGDFVECGVWRGGSAMVMALTLQRLGAAERRLWLYDVFSHFPEPGAEDVDLWGRSSEEMVADRKGPPPMTPSAQEVRATVAGTGYDPSRLVLVEGRVEDTIPAHAPEEIALLRLDTDWYSSIKHELEHLYPRVQTDGVLIIDDYGHYPSARQAVDEYFADDPLLLSRIDYTCRMAVK